MVKIVINQLVEAEVEPNKLTIDLNYSNNCILAQLLGKTHFLKIVKNFAGVMAQEFFGSLKKGEKSSTDKLVLIPGHMITGTIPEVTLIDMLRSRGYGITITSPTAHEVNLRKLVIED